jgi:hypothetical protein
VWTLPLAACTTFEVHGVTGGYTGPGVKTVIAPRGEVKISCRLVPDQDPEKICRLVEKFVKCTQPGREDQIENRCGLTSTDDRTALMRSGRDEIRVRSRAGVRPRRRLDQRRHLHGKVLKRPSCSSASPCPSWLSRAEGTTTGSRPAAESWRS